MRCQAVDQWLDEGRPAAVAADMQRHAEECARCARAISALDQVETELAAVVAAAPRSDVAREVMDRIAALREVRELAVRKPSFVVVIMDCLRLGTIPALVLLLALAGLWATPEDVLAACGQIPDPDVVVTPLLLSMPLLGWAAWRFSRRSAGISLSIAHRPGPR